MDFYNKQRTKSSLLKVAMKFNDDDDTTDTQQDTYNNERNFIVAAAGIMS